MISEEFLLQLKARDPQLLGKVFRETNPYLVKMLKANGVFGENAEDLVHQTWERFFTNLEKFEGRSELRTFLGGILLNVIREHRRAAGRIELSEDSDGALENTFTPEGLWQTMPPDPSKLLESAELGQFIAECMEGLTSAQRTAFVSKEVDGENSEDVCNVLGVSVSNLRVLIFRAKEKLRQCLEGKLK